LGVIDVSPGERPLPIASVAKVMSAVVVLADHPLKPGEEGPAITVTSTDVTEYQQAKAQGQSVVEVSAGEQLTEHQALQALLIPSGNNIAILLANWDAGGLPAFVTKLNAKARALALRNTTFADASGFDENTKSTPSDLTRLAAAAIQDPVLAEIVATPNAKIPVAGTVYNVDFDLGQGGIDGIKTGSDPAAGACFMFSSAIRVAGHAITIVGAVMALPTLEDAFAASKQLIAYVKQGLIYDQALASGQAVAEYDAPWGQRSVLRASRAVFLVEWPGRRVERRLAAGAAPIPLVSGASRGSVQVRLGDQDIRVPLVADGSLSAPGRAWRLTRLG
jgi:D-alanyl-D-alanine carboxypeptidase (penicillin-binding protein 5/6)